RAIGFDRGFEAAPAYRINQGRIKLQQGFTAGENDKAVFLPRGPGAFNRGGERLRICETAAARPVDSNEIRIAKRANRVGSVFFVAGPEVAARKAAKHRRAAALRALALQSEKNFLYRIISHAHARRCRFVEGDSFDRIDRIAQAIRTSCEVLCAYSGTAFR